jgi:putative transposase
MRPLAARLAIDVAAGIRISRVIDVLSRLVSVRGAPKYVRSDNGPEFIAKALLTWKLISRLNAHLSTPENHGKTG